MKVHRQIRAFSLLEVIIAVGLFVSSAVVIIGFIAALSRQGADSADTLAAQKLPEPLRVELARLAGSDLEALAAQIPVMSAPLTDGLAFAATREATGVESLAYLPPANDRIPAAEQYYLVECWKFQDEPLRFDAQKVFLALQVRVSWPYRLPGVADPTEPGDRSQITFTMSLTR
jgi:hypothetical protein